MVTLASSRPVWGDSCVTRGAYGEAWAGHVRAVVKIRGGNTHGHTGRVVNPLPYIGRGRLSSFEKSLLVGACASFGGAKRWRASFTKPRKRWASSLMRSV